MLSGLNTCFSHDFARRQIGMTLIEVLVAMLILTLGLLGAVMLQLNALKYTDSSRMVSQASFIAYDMLDRIRANAGADYSLRGGSRPPPSTATASVRDQDLNDFEANVRGFAGEGAKGSVTVSANEVRVSISWDDSRGENTPGARETLSLTSLIDNDPKVMQ